MNAKSTTKSRSSAATKSVPAVPSVLSEPFMSEIELARLGGGEVAYIKTLSPDEAGRMFPTIEGLPKGINLFSVHAADGTPIALTDTLQAAIGHAAEGELAIAPLH